MKILLVLLLAVAARADDYGNALAAWLHVEPITPVVVWHADKDALLALHLPGYSASNGWCYAGGAIHAFPCRAEKTMMRHEVFHATADARLPTLPRWLEEGTAAMMETARVSDGVLAFKTGSRLRAAARADVSLLTIVQLTADDFCGKNNTAAYAASYAAAVWMHQAGTLQTWLHGAPVPLDPDGFRAWLLDPGAWP